MRKLLIGFGILLAVIVGSVFWAISSTDEVLRETVESTGRAALGVEVSLAAADVDLIAGRITLTDLVVGHPPAYGGGAAIEAARIDIVMARDASDDRVMALSRVLIDAPRLTYLVRGGVSNLAVLQQRAATHAAGGQAAEAAAGPPAPRLVVRDLYIRDGRVALQQPGGAPTVPFADIHLGALGSDGGAPAVALLPPLLAALDAEAGGAPRPATPGGHP